MTRQKTAPVLILIAVVIILSSPLPTIAGAYKDRDGVSHQWHVGDAHELIWNGSPYVPFGVTFEPKSFAGGATEENLAADRAALDALKGAGVTDVLLHPGANGIYSVPVETLQKVVDLLETAGMTYGVELHDPPYAPLVGYVVEPTVYRVEGVHGSGEVSKTFENTKTALWALCDAKTGEVRRSGHAVAINGDVTVTVNLRSDADYVLLFYPERVLVDGSAGARLPDLWASFDRHRDRLLSHLSEVKFGKGLRFFIDPFSDKLGVEGEAGSLFPSSPAFRMQFAAWLSKRYSSPYEAGNAWGIVDHHVRTFADAARLVPLWKGSRGNASVYDEALGRKFAVEVGRSAIWSDFQEYRSQSVRGYMDSLSDGLKRVVADVPVVFTANGLESMFQPVGGIGYDGLAAPPSDGNAVAQAAGRVLSMAEASPRRLWVVARVKPSGEEFASKEELFSGINAYRGLCGKGFFAGGRWDAGSQSLKWLGEYASLSRSDKLFASYRPRVVYYPSKVGSWTARRLESGAWWLPGLAPGDGLNLGPNLGGYTLANFKEQVMDLYVWSAGGARTVTVAAHGDITLVSTTGEVTEAKPKKGKVRITLGREPTLIRGIEPTQFIPIEIVEEMLKELEKMVALAESRKLDATLHKINLVRASDLFKNEQYAVSLDMARVTLEDLKAAMTYAQPSPAAMTLERR